MSGDGFWARFRKDRAAFAALVVLVLLVVMVVLGPFVVGADPTHQELALRLAPPSLEIHLGGINSAVTSWQGSSTAAESRSFRVWLRPA